MAKTTKADLLASEGQISRIYGQKTLLTVSPIPEIDRVKFSIVELNTKGKDFIDIYLTTEEFRRFCVEVDNGMAKKKIDADTGAYPTAYQWVRGENGCKKLIIGGGMKGVRIQASDASDKNNSKRKMAVVQFADLHEMAFLFKIVYGLIDSKPGSYYDSLFHAFMDNVGKRRGNADYDDSNDAVTPVSMEDSAEEAIPNTTPAVTPKPTSEVPNVEKFTTTSCGNTQSAQGMKAVPVIVKETGESIKIIFTDEQVAGLSWFAKYEQKVNAAAMANSKGVDMTVMASRKGRYLYFAGLPAKN